MAKPLTREEVFERVREILVEVLVVEEDEVMETVLLYPLRRPRRFQKNQENLGADSVDLVELIMDLEKQFGINISDEDARELQTVGQVVDCVYKHQPKAA